MLNVGSCFYSTFSLSEFFYALQRAKKVVSDSPGLVDFAVGLVNPVLNLSAGQVVFWGEIQNTEELYVYFKDSWASTY